MCGVPFGASRTSARSQCATPDGEAVVCSRVMMLTGSPTAPRCPGGSAVGQGVFVLRWGEAAGPVQPSCFGSLSGYGLATGPPGAWGVNVSGPAHWGVLGGFPPHRGAAVTGCTLNAGRAKQQAGEKRGKKAGEKKNPKGPGAPISRKPTFLGAA